MGKLAKIAVWLLGIIVVVIAAGLIWLKFFLDPNDYKDQIASAVEDATGRKLEIHQPITLELFPPLSLSLGEVTFSNAKGFEEAPMAEVGSAAVQVKMLALLSKKIEVGVIRLDGMKLWLGQKADGSNNWDDLSQPQAAEQEVATPDGGGDAFSVDQLAIGGVEITNSQVTWVDEATNQRVVVSPIELTIGQITDATPFDIVGKIGLAIAEPKIALELVYKATATLDLEAQKYQLGDLKVSLSAAGDSLPNGKQTIDLAAELVADLALQTLDLNKLTINSNDVKATGNLSLTQLIDAPTFTGQLAIAEFVPRELIAKLVEVGIPTQDSKALGKASAIIRLNGNQEVVNIEIVEMLLDDSKLSGSAALEQLSAAAPFYRFDLKIDQFNVDRYLPPATNLDAKAVSNEESADINRIEIPVEWAKTLGLDGRFSLGELVANGLEMTNAQLEVSAKGGLVRLKRLAADAYDGSIEIAAALDARKQTPRYQFHSLLSGIQAGAMQQDMLDKTYISGAASVKAKLLGAGNTVGEIRRSLSGNGDMKFADGAIHGFNVALSLRKARAVLKGEQSNVASTTQQTDFSQLTASFTVKDGILNNPDLLVMSPAIRMDGKGDVNLVNETIDYHATPAIVASSKGQGGVSRDELKGVAVPIHCTGPIADPECKIDIKSVLKAELGGKIDAEKERAKDKLQDQLKRLW
jgi:AsmA protein